MNHALVRAIALCVCCLVGIRAQDSDVRPTPTCPGSSFWTGTVDADGKATERIEPDLASVSITVSSTKDTPIDARTAGQSTFDSVTSALLDAGLNDTSIQTTGFSLSPNYNTDYYYNAQGLAPTNFTFSQTINVASTPEELGTFIDAALDAGSTEVRIGEIRLSISPSLSGEALNSLRQRAVENALQTANVMIQATSPDARVGTVISITDSSYPPYVPYASAVADSGRMKAGELADATPLPTEIFSGEVDIDANVHVKVAICTQT